MSAFDTAFQLTVGTERGYSNNRSDSGGKTRWGITERVARANGYTGDMQELPFDFAKEVYRLQYWSLMNLDGVALISPRIAQELFDSGVNCGQCEAAQWLQQCLNVLNHRARDYADMTVDGLIGPLTLDALGTYLRERGTEGERVILTMLNCLQGAHYIDLATRREKDEEFIYGWMRGRVSTT